MKNKQLFTATELAKELNIRSAQKLNEMLYLAGFQYKVNGTWVPYAKFVKMNLVRLYEDNNMVYGREFTRDGRDFVLGLIDDMRGVI